MSHGRWTRIIIILWMLVVAISSVQDVIRQAAPASRWLRVIEMHVYDTWEGEAPYLSVNRVIRRPFHGEWISTVRVVSDGSNSVACLAEGRASYALDARLPPAMTLDWWTAPRRCSLDPGRYRLDTEWTIYPHDGYPPKTAVGTSNVFEVHALPEAIKRLRAGSAP